MLEAAGAALAGILIAGFLLYRRQQAGKARRVLERGEDSPGGAVCRWGFDAAGEPITVRTRMQRDAGQAPADYVIPDFLRRK